MSTDDALTTPAFYAGALNAATYDLGIGRIGNAGADDIPFYLDLARAAGGRVLELGTGTGRVAIALAEAGCTVTGVDLAPAMLAEANRKVAELTAEVGGRLRFVEGDMAGFDLGERFDAVIIPGRSFAFLLDPADQRRCLRSIHEHLRPGGTFAMQLFDPLLHLLLPGDGETRSAQSLDPDTGDTIRVDVLSRHNDSLAQVGREVWRFSRVSPAGDVLATEDEELALRWTYRYEMRYLLELTGFRVVAEYSDFDGSAAAYGREQVWVATTE